MSVDVLAQTALFGPLTDEQRIQVAERGAQRQVPEGELVFSEGDPGGEALVLLDGRVQVTLELSMQTEQAPVHTVVPGSVLGEFALAGSTERSATARALKDSTFFVLTREAFDELAEEDPRLGYVMLKELGRILVGRLVKTTRELRASLMF